MLEAKLFSLRTKTMVKILRPIVHKVAELDSYKAAENMYNESEARIVCCIMGEIHKSLSQLPEFKGSEYPKKLKIQLKAALDDFNAVYELILSQVENRTAITATQIQVVGRNLIESLYEVLLFEDSLLKEKIQESLSNCHSALCDLQRAKGNHIIIKFKESGSYLFSRMQWCISELLNVIDTSMSKEADKREESGGQFVQKMDLVLEILASIKVEEEFTDIIPQVKHILDELLCHAMAIAQVSTANDSADITASCQKVLHVFEDMKKKSASDTVNLSVRQLCCYSLAEVLESLEQQINRTLLRLVLEVFSEPYSPLKKLVKASCNIPAAGCHAEDLEVLVSALDLHVDRIMQIGMFAMACSGDEKRILGIRSCLASLESLESELVPSLTAYYLDHGRTPHRNHLKILSDHWQSEVLKLEELIDGIVDPAAFCQVALEEVLQMVATLKVSLEGEKPFLKTLLYGIQKKSLKLVKHLYVSTLGMKTFPPELKMEKAVDDLFHACKECSAAMDVFLSGSNSDDSMYLSRLLKRCKLIVSYMKKLQLLLLEHVNHAHSLEERKDSGSAPVNNFKEEGDTLVFPESIHGLPLDISHNSSKTRCTFTDGVAVKEMKLEDTHLVSGTALLPYLEKGMKLRQERSILYQTPKTVKENHQKSSMAYHTLTHRIQRRMFSRNESVNVDKHPETNLLHFSMDDSLDLEVTDILESLTSLSSTLMTQNVSTV
ncbi:hypothetical protein B7P43_G15235 [Cryptotermes secundus]|uniref:Serendipity locus protein alpha n=1 Tax=Cryptotermes secundus TaxID=105785 RepID=A0A2J7QIQ6_9NEOP|nr:uncharacterized protein LOC111867295 isoform X2 [Cryptotermes secundus]PNF28471.1 hypothetical protein B7P43_G15235 [Cryptotermes secundus]